MSRYEAGAWPVSYLGTGCSVFANADTDSGVADLQEMFEGAAIDMLWNWTGRIFGTFTETVRPCRVELPYRRSTWEGSGPEAAYYELGGTSGYGWLPVYIYGEWQNIRCGSCGGVACICAMDSSPRALVMPDPIADVGTVKIDGVTLDPAAYRLDFGSVLIRQDGESWPTAQDLLLADSMAGTWSVQLVRGTPVPRGGQIAAATLACELAKAYQGDSSCALPSRVASIARQGVSMELVQTTFEEMKDGRTGIWSIDNWVASVNVSRSVSGVASVDTIRRPRFDTSVGKR